MTKEELKKEAKEWTEKNISNGARHFLRCGECLFFNGFFNGLDN